MRATVLMPIACLLAACGQTGSLYLPDEAITSPIEIRDAPVSQAAPEAPPETPGEDDEAAPPPR